MNHKDLLNQKYQTLCQQLGDAQFKLDQLERHIAEIKSQIKSLNDASPILDQLHALSERTQAAQAGKESPLTEVKK